MEHYLNLSVSDPIKRTDGVMSYTTYKVNSTTNRPDMGGSSFSVIRRFNHFKELHSELDHEFPGAVLPPLPAKSLLGRFDEEFVETRRRNLERFLERVAVHPELKTSAQLVKFLTLDEEELTLGEDEPAAEGDTQQRSFMGWMSSTVKNARVLSTQLGATPSFNPAPTPEDLRFEELSDYVKNLEMQMESVSTHARTLKERNAALGKGLFDFGLAFTLLGNAEQNAEESPLATALGDMGKVADKLSQVTTEHAHREALQFEDPLSDYVRVIGAVRAALQKRAQRRARVGVAQAELAAKEAALARVQDVAGKEDKVGSAETSVALARQDLEKAETEFVEVTRRVVREVDRFKRDKGEDMRRISLDYIRLQVEYNQKVERAWAELIPQLEALDRSSGLSMTPSVTDTTFDDAEPQAVPPAPELNPEPRILDDSITAEV